MAKQKKIKMLSPPRYPRGDPRNEARMKAGPARGRKMQRYDLPVRKLRKKDSSYMVTIPAWLVRELGFKVGDDIVFCKTDEPGVVWIAAVKRPGDPAGKPAAGSGLPF